MSALDKYWELSQEELLDKIDELEGKIVDYKKETKTTKSESLKTIEEMKSRIEELEKSNSISEKEDFLKDKNISSEEKKIFDEKVAKWYSKDDAYLIATKESRQILENKDEISKNTLYWEDSFLQSKEIKYSEIANLNQEEYNSIMDKVDTWEIKVIPE